MEPKQRDGLSYAVLHWVLLKLSGMLVIWQRGAVTIAGVGCIGVQELVKNNDLIF
jgi:hypothetical protein